MGITTFAGSASLFIKMAYLRFFTPPTDQREINNKPLLLLSYQLVWCYNILLYIEKKDDNSGRSFSIFLTVHNQDT